MPVHLHLCLFSLALQVVPGSWVDDVPAPREMMTFDFDQECTLALCFFSASKRELEMRTRVRSLDGWPLSPLSCDADVGRPLPGRYIISCDNLFYKRRLNSEQKKNNINKHDLFKKDIGQQKRYKLFKLKFLHGFPFSKRSARCLTWNSTWTYSSAVCESSPWWPCSIAGLAVAVFIAPLCVQSSIFF